MADKEKNSRENPTEFLIYQTEDNRTRIQVRMVNETVWLSLNQMADLFQRDNSVISKHIKNIFEEGELLTNSVVAKIATTAADGKTYQIDYFNLDVIISVGYRVKSHRGTQFRIWATQHIRDYIIKGFAMDDERLKQAGGGDYFDELLRRIRDIRSSEKVFWRKVLDIYSTSIDYDPHTDMSRKFFSVVQNKIHWAAHGHTAAEIIDSRADASTPNMGMTSWTGATPTKSDTRIAKNYLSVDELETLNRIVSLYLDFAELQALNRRQMTMQSWISKLDEFLKISERDILTHAGTVSHEKALQKAHDEYEKFRARELNKPSSVEKHFEKAVEEIKQLESGKGILRKKE